MGAFANLTRHLPASFNSDTVINVVSELPKITWEKHRVPNLSSLVFKLVL